MNKSVRYDDSAVDRLRRTVRRRFAKCYWSEHSLTEDGCIPKEHYIEPAKFLDRVLKAARKDMPKRLWLVLIDGTSWGYYEGCASACLFCTYNEARGYVENELRDVVVNDILSGKNYTDEDVGREVASHCTWYSDCSVQYRAGDCVMDYSIYSMPIPKPITRKTKGGGCK